MKYMLLIYEDDAERVEKMDERMPHCAAYVEAMKKAGIYLVGRAAAWRPSTTGVRVNNGWTQVVDGPDAEAKEQLGGFHPDRRPRPRHRAGLAGALPQRQPRAVEVRPVWP